MQAGRVASILGQAEVEQDTVLLGFSDDSTAPRAFEVESTADSTGAAFLVTRYPPHSGYVWSAICRRLGESSLDVESLQLRTRGAAVILARSGGRDLVVRVAPPGPHQHLVRANHATVRELRRAFADQSSVLEKIPQPLFEIDLASTVILGESRLPGQLAWRLAAGPLGDRIYQDSLAFLDVLGGSTRQATPWSTAEMADRIEADLRGFLESNVTTSGLQKAVRLALRRVRTMLTESAAIVPCMSHGDFGYGNVLVDARSGALTGVIDWGTARRWDFPGIDRVNFEIQIRRIVSGERFPDAVEAVWQDWADHSHSALAGREHDQTRALFGLAVCRYMHRSLEHEREFGQQGAAFEEALSWLNRSVLVDR